MELFDVPSSTVNWKFLLADLDCPDEHAKKTSGRVSGMAHSCVGRGGGEFAEGHCPTCADSAIISLLPAIGFPISCGLRRIEQLRGQARFKTLAGHSNIATTRKYYLAVRSEDFAAAGELLNSILGLVQTRVTDVEGVDI